MQSVECLPIKTFPGAIGIVKGEIHESKDYLIYFVAIKIIQVFPLIDPGSQASLQKDYPRFLLLFFRKLFRGRGNRTEDCRWLL